MHDLTPLQIEIIALDIRRQAINYSHLAEDLLDHICCDVEDEMSTGLDFNTAYSMVKTRIGPRRLKEIQEETLYAVDTKYRNMKNTMKFSAIAGTILFGFATMFKIQHWPMAGVLMVLGAILLALVFMPSALVVLWKETRSRGRLLLLVSGFISGMLFIFGTLFKVQHWPLAGILLLLSMLIAVTCFIPAIVWSRFADQENNMKKPVYLLGAAGAILYLAGTLFKIQHWPLSSLLTVMALILLFLIALPLYTWLTWKDDAHVSAKFIFIIIGALLIIVPGALLNLNLRNMYNSGFSTHLRMEHQMFMVCLDRNSGFIGLYRDSLCCGPMKMLHEKTESAIASIEKLQKQLVAGPDGTTSAAAPLEYQTMSGEDMYHPAPWKSYAPLPEGSLIMPGSVQRNELGKTIEDYLLYITSLTDDSDPARFRLLLDTSAYLPANPGQHILYSSLHSLEILKTNLVTVEAAVLRALSRHNQPL